MKPLFLTLLALALPVFAAKNMEIYFVDVEGGQATLVKSPEGESILFDTGWPGFENRDANRIAAAAQLLSESPALNAAVSLLALEAPE